MTREDAIRKQEKAAIAYQTAREATEDTRRPERAVFWQILAAHEALMARNAMGLHLDEGQP